MALDAARTLRGALAGATAASAWAAQEELDQRIFRYGYSDVELLGKALTRGPAWHAVGLALHVGNGAAFGALYAAVAPRMPIAPVLRGPLAALVEHVATWPLGRVTDRLHPARAEMPPLGGSRRAFWQATWRHVLFGVVLGELERRLNPPGGPSSRPGLTPAIISSNGHGDLERALTLTDPPS